MLMRLLIAVSVACAFGILGLNTSNAADERSASLDNLIPAAMQRAALPGVIVGIWQKGQEPYVRAFGVSDTATKTPMATNMHVRIGSNTKSFTVTAILMLADRGLLSLDDSIDKYVKGAPNGDKITLRHLAAMRSGLFNYAEETIPKMPEEPSRQWTPRELLEISFAHPLLFSPGTAFDYSNTNTVLLGLVVEAVSGQSLKTFVEENIIKPAGLTHTIFPVGGEMPSPHANGYIALPDGKVVDATNWDPSWGWAAGNMISTLEDMRVWSRAFANGQLFSPEMGSLYGLAIEY